MDAPFEKGINKVTLMCAAQIGKTTIGNATIARFIHLDPCAISDKLQQLSTLIKNAFRRGGSRGRLYQVQMNS